MALFGSVSRQRLGVVLPPPLSVNVLADTLRASARIAVSLQLPTIGRRLRVS